MIKLENYEVMGWDHAIRGMRNPMNSWNKSDSKFCDMGEGCNVDCKEHDTCPLAWQNGLGADREYIGPNDHELILKLAKNGSVHAKYRRMITVYIDITAPLYWWKEFDTYKVGTVANSCSTMHKIAEKEFMPEDFSHEHLLNEQPYDLSVKDTDTDEIIPCNVRIGTESVLFLTINMLNAYREKYLEAKHSPSLIMQGKDKEYWWQMIQLLPSSYNQKRTVMLNYEVLASIYKYRRDHKLDEWREFCKWINGLPYSDIITGEGDDNVKG